ncbi:hypothetical protein HELRODRAFT_165480 [Helobdella robusta]|uniref:Uncharacterized protein n=1 Tax=Helobdella robusta TaxID=6412 RepID=T1EWV9_HELRO|nr:hypothetical protein HELRODRAFT_165480 [Helobdella robusta]ESN91446.1 hypothetical protein HELRODRAFT_165480 [Helobdella robusta]
MANDISMGEEAGLSCSRRTRSISLPDKPGRYSTCMAIFTGICHLVCGIACLVLRTEIYSRIQYSLLTYEVVFLLVLSIIATLACNINNFVVTFMISVLTDIEYSKLFRAYRRDYYKLEILQSRDPSN